MVKAVLWILATLTLLADGIIVAALILYIAERLKITNLFSKTRIFFRPHQYMLSFTLTLVAMLGSLFFSEVAKFAPCILCWFQRIAVYPQPFLLYTAIARDERVITPYLIVLNIAGIIISLYHNFILYFPRSEFFNCEVGGQISCTKNFFLYFGYITIPMMCLTALVLNLLILTLLSKPDSKTKNFIKKLVN